MTAFSTFKFSLACGAGNTYVDVTEDVIFEEGDIPFTEGRDSQFDDTPPAVWSFTLGNGTGKYTPGNPLTTLAVPLAEGMGAVMELDGQKFAGTVRGIVVIFPAKELANTARVRVTVDDMLGNAARKPFGSTTDLILSAKPFYLWKLDDPAGSLAASEAVSVSRPTIWFDRSDPTATVVFGATGVPGMDLTQVQLTASSAPAEINFGTTPSNASARLPALSYASITDLGWWTFAATTLSDQQVYGPLELYYRNFPYTSGSFTFDIGPYWITSATYARFKTYGGTGSTTVGPLIVPGVPHIYSLHLTTVTAAGTTTLYGTPYLDGVAFSSAVSIASFSGTPTNAQVSPTDGDFSVNSVDGAARGVAYSALALTANPVPLQVFVAQATATQRLTDIAAAVPEVTLDTVPAMSPAILGEMGGTSVLDALNEVIESEQGYMWVETTGTLLAPTPKIKTLPRNRARAVDYTLDVSEILDPIPFIRNLTNLISTFTADGPNDSATYQDLTLVPLVGSASSSGSVALRDRRDLHAYASDRVSRASNRNVTIPSITIDATSPRISRWTDFSAIRQGHKIRITGLPITQLGYSTWDGFVIGRSILNTQDENKVPKTLFTYNLQPAREIPVFGTGRYSAGGTLTLQSNITNSASSMGVVSTGALFTTTGGYFPQNLLIGTEIVTVSVMSGASSPQTATITARGVTGGSAAAAWPAGTAIDIAPVLGYDF